MITGDRIADLHISPATCVDWVKESFSLKSSAQLPPKISLHPQGNDFFNTMPCLLPERFHRFGVKVVHRIAGGIPALGSDIWLYDSTTGELLAMLDGDWITTMRTGAVATLATQTLRKSGDNPQYAFVGLGNTARATVLCLLDSEPNMQHRIKLLRYKNQAELFIERFEKFSNVTFEIVDDIHDLITASDIIISCITNADELLCEDDRAFREGCLVVPVHTKGFQNCDLFFDRVFADDTSHVRGFRYFDRFKGFAELGSVLEGSDPGRTSDTERILSYNIGLGLHDILFADKIYCMANAGATDVPIGHTEIKYWI